LPKFTRLWCKVWIHNICLNSQAKLFQHVRASKFSNYEKDSLKSFFNILKAYGLNKQRESNIGVVKKSKSETKVLTYQPKQGGHLRVVKEELQ
jgi:hypothetical protein